jgi:hypothetical protein
MSKLDNFTKSTKHNFFIFFQFCHIKTFFSNKITLINIGIDYCSKKYPQNTLITIIYFSFTFVRIELVGTSDQWGLKLGSMTLILFLFLLVDLLCNCKFLHSVIHHYEVSKVYFMLFLFLISLLFFSFK